MKKLIIYTTGGLSNRVLPIISAITLAKRYNRELLIYWPTDRACLCHFNDLYDTEFKFIDDIFLNTLNDSMIEYHVKYEASIVNDNKIYGRTFLFNKHNENKVNLDHTIDFGCDSDIMIMDNNFIHGSTTHEENVTELQNLKFKKSLVDEANKIGDSLGLDDSVVGIHARGTDFIIDISFYVNQINQVLSERGDTKLYIASDDKTLEDTLINQYPNNIIRRVKTNYMEKEYNRTLDRMEDSIIDLLLLAKTDFKVYNNLSSFTTYIKMLSEKK
jgi:hypothetical protein